MRLLSVSFFSVLLALTTALPHRRSLHIPLYKKSTLTKNGVVNLGVAHGHATRSERKYFQGRAAYERHTSPHAPSSSGPTRRGVPPEVLTDEKDVRWYGTISVGTPPVNYEVIFDTGSSDLLLPGANCGSTCDGHTLYNPNASSSATDLHRTAFLEYGDGSKTSGEQYTDTVTISGLVAKNQTLIAASQYPPHFSTDKFPPDGIMGMGFAEISVSRSPPVVQTLIAEGQLPEPVFAFKLDEGESQLTIGSADTSLYTGFFIYTPVVDPGYWKITVDSININGQVVTKNVSAIVDTGTTLMIAGPQTISTFYSGTNAVSAGNGFYMMPCNAMPNISVTIEGKTFPISAETFNLGLYNATSEDCVGAIAGSGSLGDSWILGDTFLRNVYSLFDVGNLQVGFADLA